MRNSGVAFSFGFSAQWKWICSITKHLIERWAIRNSDFESLVSNERFCDIIIWLKPHSIHIYLLKLSILGLFNYLSARWVSLLVLQLFQLDDLLAISDQTIRFIVDCCCCCLVISELLLPLFPNTNVSAQDMEQWYSKPSEYNNMRTERNRTFFFFMRWWMHFVFASSCWWLMAERFRSFGWHWQTQKKIKFQIKHQQSEQFVTIIIYTISS